MQIQEMVLAQMLTEVKGAIRVFTRRLTSGGIFNNRLLFYLLFSGNFYGGTRP